MTPLIKTPFALIIFGASGDLAKLKLFPAIYQLYISNKLPKEFHIVGYARTKMKQKEFQKEFEKAVKQKFRRSTNNKKLKSLIKHLSYVKGQYNSKNDFELLRKHISEISKKPSITKIAYFSVPPVAFKDIIQNLGETKRSPQEDTRLVIEKPFGQDTESARDLYHFVSRYFEETKIFLLDHYLGKTGVQSIMALRHSNRILNLMIKGSEIANIQVTAAEDIGVTDRVGYFDAVGTIKDMFQSHLLQILALITMSIPVSESAESIHKEKFSILSALKFIESEKNISIGQYKGYKSLSEVPKNSNTETFMAARLFIDRETWHNVPIYVRSGKMLHEKHTYVVITLKKFDFQPKDEEPNRLVLELHPSERINIRFINKQLDEQYQTVITSDSLSCEGPECLPEHAVLLLDVLESNHTYFLTFPQIIATWQLTDRVIKLIKRKNIKPETYQPGSEGPKSQTNLTKLDKFTWFDPHQQR